MLFKMSLRNIRKSIRDYAIYFLTLIIGVAIFYVFNSIEKQTVMLNITNDQRATIKETIYALSYLSIFVALILGFLIIYANRFLIKRRSQEFGIYLLLGMEKVKISTILFIETLFIGLFSLAVGLGAGIFLSQFMSILVADTFEADISGFRFVFSSDACIKTCLYFGIMNLIVMIFNILILGKYKLINLIQAKRENENIRLKSPVLCIIVFIIAVIMLGYAYYLVTDGIERIIHYPKNLLVAIVLGAVSTLLIFWTISGLLTKIAMSIKKLYYKGLNSFMIRQLSSKINTTVFSMTIICLMLFITICILSVSTSVKKSLEDRIAKHCKADIEMTRGAVFYNNSDDGSVTFEFEEQDRIWNIYRQAGYDLAACFEDYVDYYVYNTYQLSENTENMITNVVISLSDYNRIAKLMRNKVQELNDDEYLILSNDDRDVNRYNKILAENQNILEINNDKLKPRYKECVEGMINLSNGESDGAYGQAYYIVPDETLKDCTPYFNSVIANYNGKSKQEKRKIEKSIYDITEKIHDVAGLDIHIESKIQIYDENVGVGIMFIFLGLYLGIVFLISGAAILALKELSESADNISRYDVIRKIGADEKMIHKALFGQIGIFFAFPLILACIHSIFGIRFAMFAIFAVSMFIKDGLMNSIISTAAIVVAIYGGYFLLTYLCSKSIIKHRF